MKTRNTMGAMALMLATLLFAAGAWGDVSGTWAMTVETQRGSTTSTLTLTQDGNEVTGTVSGQRGGEVPVTGTVDGDQVTLVATRSMQGRELEITYSGTVDGDTMNGQVALGQLGSSSFTAQRE